MEESWIEDLEKETARVEARLEQELANLKAHLKDRSTELQDRFDRLDHSMQDYREMFVLNLQAIEQFRRHVTGEQDVELTRSKLQDIVFDQVGILNKMERRKAQTE